MFTPGDRLLHTEWGKNCTFKEYEDENKTGPFDCAWVVVDRIGLRFNVERLVTIKNLHDAPPKPMKFKCIKTVEMPWHKEGSDQRLPFVEGRIYESWYKDTNRNHLSLINESGWNHGTGYHWLHWSRSEWFREHFVRVA